MMQFLRPSFTLVGSVAEGTRIGLGSELDLTVRFLGLEDVPFKFRVDDPFHLYEGGESPECLSWYFEDSKFQLHRFKQDVLDLVDSSLMSIFDRGDNPPRLSIKQPNRHSEATLRDTALIVSEGKSIYGLIPGSNMQRANCMVLTSQSKLGICLQFLWTSAYGEEAYCSVDLIPVFRYTSFLSL